MIKRYKFYKNVRVIPRLIALALILRSEFRILCLFGFVNSENDNKKIKFKNLVRKLKKNVILMRKIMKLYKRYFNKVKI